MKLHWRLHLNAGKQFKCERCPESFNFKQLYVAHMRNHRGEKPFQCAVCGVAFNLNGKLKEHMNRTHPDPNTSHECEQCGKRFMQIARLKVHRTTHSELRLFDCEVCSKPFKTKKTLRQHKLVHSEVKRFKCNYCDMWFTQSSGRRGHERSRHL